MLRNTLLCGVALASGLVFPACQTSRQPAPTNKASTDITAINATRSRFEAVYIVHDAAGAAALFASDAVPMLLNQPAIEGRPTTSYRGLLELVASGNLKPDRLITRCLPVEETSHTLNAMSSYNTIGSNVITQW